MQEASTGSDHNPENTNHRGLSQYGSPVPRVPRPPTNLQTSYALFFFLKMHKLYILKKNLPASDATE